MLIDEEKKKIKKIRKYKPDGSKKIKARTHKNIEKILNSDLCKNNGKRYLIIYLKCLYVM